MPSSYSSRLLMGLLISIAGQLYTEILSLIIFYWTVRKESRFVTLVYQKLSKRGKLSRSSAEPQLTSLLKSSLIRDMKAFL
jgi:hypothetical protein